MRRVKIGSIGGYPLMRERIADLAAGIRRAYGIVSEAAERARKADPGLAVAIPKTAVPLSVCAVDGGLLSERMHGADIVVSRSVGVNFTYDGPRLGSYAYHPKKCPEPDIDMRDSLDEHEANLFRSLVRLKSELGCAISTLERFSPGLLLIDGSLLPLPTDRPEDKSPLRPLYQDVLGLYWRLFSLSKEKKCMLCGVIKDSRSRALSESLGLSCPDTLLCGYLLKEGERTRAMPYHPENKGLKELLELGEGVRVFYLKPSDDDLPLRVEAQDCDADSAASIICSLSQISDNFAYPAILIEADMCAALDPKEMEPIRSSLISMSGLKPMRRSSRPFR
jgi:NurA domain